MNVEIIKEEYNPLLGRREVEFQLEDKPTPTRVKIKTELSKKLKTGENLIVIDIIDQKTGYNLITGKAKVYDKEEIMRKIEPEYLTRRDRVVGDEGKSASGDSTTSKPSTSEEAPASSQTTEEVAKVSEQDKENTATTPQTNPANHPTDQPTDQPKTTTKANPE